MTFSRRTFVRLSLGSALSMATDRLLAQGVSPHTAKPVPRQAPSGRPFDAHFVDVSSAAGLRAPTIYGGVESKKYILESTGCGCAFVDYDNDGWMDLFLLSGTRLEGAPPGATNRLYKNNRDGTFTDVTEEPAWVPWVGLPESVSGTTTTTALKISSAPASARTFSTGTTATEPSRM